MSSVETQSEIGEMRIVARSVKFLALLAVIVCAALPAHASRVRSVNLEEMTQLAGTIFSGRLSQIRVVRDPKLDRDVTLLTFDVSRAVKGHPGRTVTVKMLGQLDVGSERRGGVIGLPRFRNGEEIILFLYGESALGLTSPVGFGQGKFVITKDKQGRPVAMNEFGNRSLFRGLSPTASKRLGRTVEQWRGRKGISSDALLGMVEALKR